MEKPSRLLSLDVLRGITVAGMILVNNGYGESFQVLQHCSWNGMTPCDLVFPFFLFIMGISTYLSLVKQQFRPSGPVLRKIFRRTAVIFLIGLGINYFDLIVGTGSFSMAHLRIWAVLQRIALCYMAASLIALYLPHRHIPALIAVLLAVYSAILLLGNGYACDETSILARVDNALFSHDHLYRKSPIDPEGLVGTLSAIAHTLIGFWCGRLIATGNDTHDKTLRLLLLGAVLIIGGYLLQFGLPLNKRIWSPSYVLATCGLAASLQGLLMYVIDIRDRRRWAVPFQVFGVNPLFLYVLSELLAIIFGHSGINDAIYAAIHAVLPWPQWASLAYALFYVALCGLIGWPLFRRRIYIKI